MVASDFLNGESIDREVKTNEAFVLSTFDEK